MQEYQKRVVEEFENLEDKIERLGNFINSEKINTVPEMEASRLGQQYIAMGVYSQILAERIENFNIAG